MALFGYKVLPAAVLVLGASVAAAQATAPAKPACDVAEAAKGNAARATLSVNLAREAAAPAVAAKNLDNAVKLVEKTDKGDDPVVNAYVLGTALSLWANQPGVGLSTTRGKVGFTENPAGKLDIPTALDSLFSIVETSKPMCGDYTAYWRAGQKFYLETVNSAIASLNSDKLDSAVYFATAANRLYSKSPYGVMVLGNVASKKDDNAKAAEYWTKAADIAMRDSAYRDVRRQMLANLGQLYVGDMEKATPAQKVEIARKIEATYNDLIAMPGNRPQFVSSARQSIQNAYLMAGDTADAVKSWQPLIANPSNYDYLDLLNSAVSASRANRIADAAKLFDGTLQQNPYSRDALYNVAVTLLTQEQNDRVGPIVARLVAVDPGNPENYNLAARAYLAMAKAAQSAKKQPLYVAYNDTTISWYNRGNKLPIEVNFREFSPGEKQTTLAGTILDRRDKADDAQTQPAAPPKAAKGKAAAPAKVSPKSYPARPYTLTFSALDKGGNVLGTQSVTTNPLSPGQNTKFSVTIQAANAVAYRYTIGE